MAGESKKYEVVGDCPIIGADGVSVEPGGIVELVHNPEGDGRHHDNRVNVDAMVSAGLVREVKAGSKATGKAGDQ